MHWLLTEWARKEHPYFGAQEYQNCCLQSRLWSSWRLQMRSQLDSKLTKIQYSCCSRMLHSSSQQQHPTFANPSTLMPQAILRQQNRHDCEVLEQLMQRSSKHLKAFGDKHPSYHQHRAGQRITPFVVVIGSAGKKGFVDQQQAHERKCNPSYPPESIQEGRIASQNQSPT